MGTNDVQQLADEVSESRNARAEILRCIEILEADDEAQKTVDVGCFIAAVGEYLRAEELLLNRLVETILAEDLVQSFLG